MTQRLDQMNSVLSANSLTKKQPHQDSPISAFDQPFRINNAYTNTVDTEKDGFRVVFSYCSKNSSVSVLDAFSSSSCLKRIY